MLRQRHSEGLLNSSGLVFLCDVGRPLSTVSGDDFHVLATVSSVARSVMSASEFKMWTAAETHEISHYLLFWPLNLYWWRRKKCIIVIPVQCFKCCHHGIVIARIDPKTTTFIYLCHRIYDSNRSSTLHDIILYLTYNSLNYNGWQPNEKSVPRKMPVSHAQNRKKKHYDLEADYQPSKQYRWAVSIKRDIKMSRVPSVFKHIIIIIFIPTFRYKKTKTSVKKKST